MGTRSTKIHRADAKAQYRPKAHSPGALVPTMACAGKRLFATKNAARRHAQQYTRLTSPYYCHACNGWHLTSGKPKRKVPERGDPLNGQWPLDRTTK